MFLILCISTEVQILTNAFKAEACQIHLAWINTGFHICYGAVFSNSLLWMLRVRAAFEELQLSKTSAAVLTL